MENTFKGSKNYVARALFLRVHHPARRRADRHADTYADAHALGKLHCVHFAVSFHVSASLRSCTAARLVCARGQKAMKSASRQFLD